MTLGHNHGEIAIEGRTAHLTLQGLSRLMRSVIIEFVMRQPSVEHEPYEYLLEQNGIVKIKMAPNFWVGNNSGDITKDGRKKLEGFLEQLSSFLLKEPNYSITDLRSVLYDSCKFSTRIEKKNRLPYLALHVLFNMHVSKQYRVEIPSAIEMLIQKELTEPSSESLLSYAISGQTIPWSLEVHKKELKNYLRQRSNTNGLRLPRLFEAALTLELAERLRGDGDMEECRKIVALAVENHPGNSRLLEAETSLRLDAPIRWRDIMLPAAEGVRADLFP